jgi:ribosomal protein S18 acetylase RimI-like enzyme
VDAADTALAFGQYYERLGCCHLGRLVVAPEQRGKGIGELLVTELIARGTLALGIARCSLFVLDYNTRARNLYRKLGFVEAQYPERLPLPDCLYLRREPQEPG